MTGTNETATPTPQQLLDFERSNLKHTGPKENRIVDQFGIRPPRYYQLLHRAAWSEEGHQHDPITARIIRDRNAR